MCAPPHLFQSDQLCGPCGLRELCVKDTPYLGIAASQCVERRPAKHAAAVDFWAGVGIGSRAKSGRQAIA